MTLAFEDDITNRERAERFHAAIRSYNDEWDVDTNLIDLLADARHWCDREGRSYAEFDRLAYQHYVAEITATRRRRP